MRFALVACLAACTSTPPPSSGNELGAASVMSNSSLGVTAAWAEKAYGFVDNNDSYGVYMIHFAVGAAPGQRCDDPRGAVELEQPFSDLEIDTDHVFPPGSPSGSFVADTGTFPVVDAVTTTSDPTRTVVTFDTALLTTGSVIVTSSTPQLIKGTFTASGTAIDSPTVSGSFEAGLCPNQ